MLALTFDILTPESFLARLEKGGALPGVVACIGGEAYFHRIVTDRLQAALAHQLGNAVERLSYAAGEFWEAAEITAPLSTLSLFGQGTLVKIHLAEQLTPEMCEALWRLTPDPAERGALLLVGQKLPKDFSPPSGWLINAATPRRERLQEWFPWVDRMAKDRGLRVAPDARQLLVESGESLAEIDGELEKLSYVVPASGVVDRALAEAHGSGRVHASIFELMPALADRRTDDALTILNSLRNDGEESSRLMAFIANEWNLLWEARLLLDRGAPQAEAARQLGVTPGRWFFVQQTAKRVMSNRFSAGVEALLAADGALKTSEGDPELVWEELVWRLCGVVAGPHDR